MSKLRVVLIVIVGAAVAAVVAVTLGVALAPRTTVRDDAISESPAPAPTPSVDMSRLEEVLAMEPTERCRFDLAVELEASATHTWEEICAVNQTIGDGALAEALGNPEELSYGWSVETSTGRVLIHVSAPWVDDTASLLKPFGDLVEVTEGPLITG